jgi:hypothetical protein
MTRAASVVIKTFMVHAFNAGLLGKSNGDAVSLEKQLRRRGPSPVVFCVSSGWSWLPLMGTGP